MRLQEEKLSVKWSHKSTPLVVFCNLKTNHQCQQKYKNILKESIQRFFVKSCDYASNTILGTLIYVIIRKNCQHFKGSYQQL